MIFAFVALAVLSWPFAAIFSDTYLQVQQLGVVLLAFLVGLVPFTVLFVLQRVFYSLGDTRTPFFIQVVQATLYVTGAGLVWFLADRGTLPVPLIAVSLALVLSIAGTVQTVVAAVLLRRRLHGLEVAPVVGRGLWYFGAALLAALAGGGVLWALGGVGEGSFTVDGAIPAVVSMAAAGTAMAVVYFAVLWLTRNPELRALLAPIMRRVGRK
jgi:putative peptidoglycan lipid II flippase